MVVVVGAFAPGDTVLDTDDPALQLDGASDIAMVTTALGTFAYVVGKDDDGFSAFRVGSDGSLTNILNVENSAAIPLIGTSQVTSATINGKNFLYVEGGTGANNLEALNVFSIADDGMLTLIQKVAEGAFSTGPVFGLGEAMHTFSTGDKTYLYTRGDGSGSQFGDFLNLFRIGSDGLLTMTTSLQAGSNFTKDSTALTVGGRTFLIEALPQLLSGTSILFVYEVLSDGTIVDASSVNAATTPEIFYPIDLATAVIDDTPYVVAANPLTKVADPMPISVLRLEEDGTLTPVSTFTDIGPVLEVETFVLDGETFVAACSAGEITLLRLDASGSLDLVSRRSLDVGVYLTDLTVRIIDGVPVAIGTNIYSTSQDPLQTYVLGTGNDTIAGGNSDDTLLGFGGDDVIDGQAGADVLKGGTGNDILIGGLGNDTIDGGEGIDTVDYSDRTTAVGVVLAAGGAIGESSETDIILNIENVIGGSGHDTITGNGVDNLLQGNDGNDVINGEDGNDTLVGGLGSDTLDGGNDNDTITDGSADGSANSVNGGAGDDVLHNTAVGTGGFWDGGTGNDTLDLSGNTSGGTIFLGEGVLFTMAGTGFSNFENVIATDGNDLIVGSSFINTIDGQDGDDTIDGGLGNDIIDGGTGSDTARYSTSSGIVVVTLNGATSVLAAIGSTGEEDTLVNIENVEGGSADDQLWGDSQANLLSGNGGRDDLNGQGGADVLVGGDGDDLLQGGDGADTLDGGTDIDSLFGGAGDDTYIVDSASDLVQEDVGAGVDLVNASVSLTLSDNVENLTLTGTSGLKGTGNALGNILTGNAGNDTLDGGTGKDTLVGGIGNDIYIVDNSGDSINETSTGGTDTVKASISFTLANYVENLALTGTANIKATGNVAANVLTGNAGANKLSGLAGNDTLSGGSDKDVVTGGRGTDKLTGGAGADTFVFAHGDTVVSKTRADTILDMNGKQGDRIDLHLVDANEDKDGNQPFHFIGTSKFSGHAGELRYEKAASDTWIYADTDGDRKIDFTVHLDDAMTLKGDYFML